MRSLSNFLNSLYNGKGGYKRLVCSPLPYMGGKSSAIGYIAELLPNNLRRIISPFFGGGSFEIACASHLGIKVVGSDISEALINYWRHQIEKPEELYNSLKKLTLNREEFERVRRICLGWQNGDIELTALELATYFYFNHTNSFGPEFVGYFAPSRIKKGKARTHAEPVRNAKIKNIKVRHCSFEEMFKKYPNDFFYCDPPYFKKTDCESSEITRNAYMDHEKFDHYKLAECIKNHKGGFILSYNDTDLFRQLYKNYNKTYPKWEYYSSKATKKSMEVLAYKYKRQLGTL